MEPCMSSITFQVIASNSAAFPAGSRVGGYMNDGRLIELAGLEVERITSTLAGSAVLIYTALGYQFTISMEEYQRVNPSESVPSG